MKTKCIMIQGTMSDAGKSVVCAALCRIFKQDGYSVAPFKSQNMALNSYITRDGLEMGRAQVMQAEACGIEPDVRMNPVLLKPSSDVGSQIIVLGEIRGEMSAMDYHHYKKELLPEVRKAFDELSEDHDMIVIEGAGSPAEINLAENDIVNMGLARYLDAPVLLVGDIDRGGVFAQLYGTAELVDPEDRARIEGMIINKFRGDVEILRPGLDMLEDKTGIPVLGVIPMIDVDLDDEDSLSSRLDRNTKNPIDIAVVRLPRLSNFTDFNALEIKDLSSVRYVRDVKDLGNPDLIILPGTKNTMDDLLWLRQSGLEAEILKFAAAGGMILGVCGGYQMLGEQLFNPQLLEGRTEYLRGMGLLPVETTFTADKSRTRVQGTVQASPFTGVRIDSYEIHMGRSDVHGEAFCMLDNGKTDGCRQGNVYGTYLHGLFDTGEMTEALIGVLARSKGLDPDSFEAYSHDEYVQQQYDILADAVRKALDMNKIYEIMEKYENE
ncbi:MAG: cobyric acid synthase [Bacillota bacterium]|nr:cobyric acid synthase [Bacillota bacterium]